MKFNYIFSLIKRLLKGCFCSAMSLNWHFIIISHIHYSLIDRRCPIVLLFLIWCTFIKLFDTLYNFDCRACIIVGLYFKKKRVSYLLVSTKKPILPI